MVQKSKESSENLLGTDELKCCLYCGRDTYDKSGICDYCLGDKDFDDMEREYFKNF